MTLGTRPATAPTRSDRERWNERHAARIAAGDGDRAPSAWLVEHVDLLRAQPRGLALDVAAGTGRNALLLAELGFRVEAVDVSDVAMAHLEARAADRGLPVLARVADLGRETLPAGRYEVVVNACFLDRRLFAALAAALAPGGLLFFDTFLATPDDERWALRPGELRAAFADVEIIAHREGRAEHRDRPRASIVARRPPSISGMSGSRLRRGDG